MIQYNKKSVIMVERLCYYYKGGLGMGSCSRHVVSVVDGAGLNSVISRSAVQATHVPRAW